VAQIFVSRDVNCLVVEMAQWHRFLYQGMLTALWRRWHSGTYFCINGC